MSFCFLHYIVTRKKELCEKPSFAFASNLLAVSAILNHLEKDTGRGKKDYERMITRIKNKCNCPL